MYESFHCYLRQIARIAKPCRKSSSMRLGIAWIGTHGWVGRSQQRFSARLARRLHLSRNEAWVSEHPWSIHIDVRRARTVWGIGGVKMSEARVGKGLCGTTDPWWGLHFRPDNTSPELTRCTPIQFPRVWRSRSDEPPPESCSASTNPSRRGCPAHHRFLEYKVGRLCLFGDHPTYIRSSISTRPDLNMTDQSNNTPAAPERATT